MDRTGLDSRGVTLQQVSASTFVATDPRLQSNVGAIVFDDFIVAVDAGMRPYATRVVRTALEREYARPVKYLCVTHYHGDHTFGLGLFKDVTILASGEILDSFARDPGRTKEGLAQRVKEDPEAAEWVGEVEFVTPSALFHEQIDIVCRGRSVRFRHVGGHTSCSVYGYLPDEQVLFTGDLLFAGGFPFAGDETTDPEVWMSTLREFLRMDIRHVIPGHGPVSGRDELEKQLRFFEDLKSNTLAAVLAGQSWRQILIPPVYEEAEEEWFAERTLQRWYEYYRDRPPSETGTESVAFDDDRR
jgi:cyclase